LVKALILVNEVDRIFLILLKLKAMVMFLNYTYSKVEATIKEFSLLASVPVSSRFE
jgi:hypothetical protein